MNVFKKKKITGQNNVLTDNYVPASLPGYGEKLETFVTSEYSMNKPEVIEEHYCKLEEKLNDVIATCDHHSAGSECDHYIDAVTEDLMAVHEAEIAEHENQITRIRSAREMRKSALERMISPLKNKTEVLESEIKPLESLRPQFQLRIGNCNIPIGLIITVIAMIVDACVNYNFLQNILLSNAYLLIITVICMSLMSDASMWALATFISRKDEKFISKPLYYIVCGGFLSMFLLSVVGSVVIRFGSMDNTFGIVNAAGEFISKESYSLAEYGVTSLTSFVTTATGILSFAFSLDKNEFSICIREKKKKELANCIAKLEPLLNELALLKNAPDPKERDERKRMAAEHHIQEIRISMKLHCRKQMTVLINDPNFTEKMSVSAEKLLSTNCKNIVPLTQNPSISLQTAN